MRSWFEIRDAKTSAEVLIYDEIGLFGISANDFVRELQGLRGKTLNLFINSPGGDVFDGIAIYNALNRHEGAINVTVDALAASIASVIAQAGDSRKMAKAATMMIHEPFGVAMGDKATMDKMAEELDLLAGQIATIYASRAGGDAGMWREKMAAETWYSAEDAITANLADDFTEERGVKALAGRVFNLSKFKNVPDWVQQKNAANAISATFSGTTWTDAAGDWKVVNPSQSQPSSIPPEPAVQDTQGGDEMSDLTEVRRTLGIDEEADVIQAITHLKSQAVDIATGEKGEANALRRQLQDAQASYLELQAKAAQDILEMKDTSRKTEATYKVQAAIDSGRILPSDKDIAMDLALNSPERYDEFASKQRLDLRERGRQVDDALAAIEPTAEEIAIGKQMGQTREQLMAQKAADRGIKVPS